uniref:Uncharacterized protein n=1 Tax=uncultured prokaryote TaxID=198431 RepID=A0A0H5Q4J8_9ZZZZ|nr:hypothetical protein [uncultured prokaryote]
MDVLTDEWILAPNLIMPKIPSADHMELRRKEDQGVDASVGVTLTQEVKDLYDKNFKSLKKELKKTSEDGKISHDHGLAGSI